MTKTTLLSLSLAMLVATVVFTQARPDFSGTWVVDPKKPAASGGGGTMRPKGAGGAAGRATVEGAGPIEHRIAQTDASLTIERTPGTSTQKFVYTFDGAENVNVNNRTTIRSKSRWDGARLITEGTETVSTSSGEISSTFREVRSVGADGSMLVEITRTTDAGPRSTSTAYVKKQISR